jgi:hypothetical protein
MSGLDVSVYERVIRVYPWLSEIILIAQDEVDRISMKFPEDMTLEDIVKAVRHAKVFLEEGDLPFDFPVNKRRDILNLYEKTAGEISSWKER